MHNKETCTINFKMIEIDHLNITECEEYFDNLYYRINPMLTKQQREDKKMKSYYEILKE